MFNRDTAYVPKRWRYGFVLVAVSFLFLMFTLGVYAEEVVFKVKFQGEDVPGECLVALIFTAQVGYCTTYEGSAELGGQLQPGDYIAWIYIHDEDMERVYGDDVFQQPGQKVIDFSVKKGVKTVENVNLPTAFEFVQSPDFARIWQLSSSMLGGMFGGDMLGDMLGGGVGGGDKVKVVVRFRGRQIVYANLGEQRLLELSEIVKEHGSIERRPKVEGRNLIMILAPKSSS
jgi:hypothetical protein